MLEQAVDYVDTMEQIDRDAIKLFELESVQAIITFKWNTFGKRFFLAEMRKYCWLLLLFTLTTGYFERLVRTALGC